jgi:hypothetical protein
VGAVSEGLILTQEAIVYKPKTLEEALEYIEFLQRKEKTLESLQSPERAEREFISLVEYTLIGMGLPKYYEVKPRRYVEHPDKIMIRCKECGRWVVPEFRIFDTECEFMQNQLPILWDHIVNDHGITPELNLRNKPRYW